MKKFLSIILLSLVLFFCVSCNNTNEPVESETNSVNTNSTDNTVGENELNTTNKDESIDNGSTQSEIELNMDNFTSYLTYTSVEETYGMRVREVYTVSGALRYAYYKNVVVTFCVESNSADPTFEVSLNAAGDGTFTSDEIRGYTRGCEVSVISVSGEVIIPNMKV